VVLIVVALAIGIGGTWFAMRACDGQGGSFHMAGCGMPSKGASSGCGMGARAVAGKGKILFYRNPMNSSITSPEPRQDEMGMAYLPVYANDGK
jgi:hypothetical protein